MGRKSIQAIIILLVFGAGCKKGDPVPPLPTNVTGTKVYVVCEGSLGNGNSALSLYLPDKDSAYEDVYKAVNGQSLGDIFQSMTKLGNQYFLCINNSDLIIIINKDTWKKEGMIGVNKPRYILPVSNDKAYVSSLFGSSLYMIDPISQFNIGQLILPYKNPEGMALMGNTAYIANWDTACSELYTLDATTNLPTATIPLPGKAPHDILVDKENKLWILTGNVYEGTQATLIRYDPIAHTVLKTYSFATGADPVKPVLNPTKDTLYFIEVNYSGGTTNNGVFRMAIGDASLPTQPFVAAQGFQYFWGLGIDPKTGYIYVGDPKGFTQRGTGLIYSQQGTLLKTFTTGIGPGHFFFDE